MNKNRLSAAIALTFVLALPALAQEAPKSDNIAKIVFFKPKPGMEQQLNEGLKKHHAWHKEHGGKWTWATWVVETGQNTGSYGSGTFGHNWADFDKPDVDPDADRADVAKNIAPYAAEGAEWQYFEMLPDLSKPPAKAPAMNEVILFSVKSGKDGEFSALIKKFHEAIKKTNWPVNYTWYTRFNGGEGPFFVLVIPHDTYADMKGPEKNFVQMLTEALGESEANAALGRWGDAIKSEHSELIRNRADLSYSPEAKK